MPAKQQIVAKEQESVQAEKEDTTQLYIGLTINEKGFVLSLVRGPIGWMGGTESNRSESPRFWVLVVENCCKLKEDKSGSIMN
jgi:hypothetical protein